MIDFAIGRDQVEVPLEQAMIVCPSHAEPFRARWPLGWATFAPEVAGLALDSPMLQAGLNSPAWRKATIWWADLPRRRTPAEVRALLDSRPACEWLAPADLLRAYEACGVGVTAICNVCHLLALGTPYGHRSGQGYVITPHICFRDVVGGRA